MPSERATRDDFLVAAEHIRRLMALSDELDELIPCGWLSNDEAAQVRAIPDFLFQCVLDEHPLVRTVRDSIASLLTTFDEPEVAAVIWENARVVEAREVLEQTAPTSDQQKLETAVGHINVLLGIIRGLDEGEECKQLVERHDEDIADAVAFVRAHAKPDPPDVRPYTVIGFSSVDELIANLRDQHEQPDPSSDYGEEDEDWLVP
jgi:hypothetical protein